MDKSAVTYNKMSKEKKPCKFCHTSIGGQDGYEEAIENYWVVFQWVNASGSGWSGSRVADQFIESLGSTGRSCVQGNVLSSVDYSD